MVTLRAGMLLLVILLTQGKNPIMLKHLWGKKLKDLKNLRTCCFLTV
jgi:hypothetical protein